MKRFNNKKLEIFCGTGGVGKTTLATSRALYLAQDKSKRILLLTIDPAKRLKEVLGMHDNKAGEIEKITCFDNIKNLDAMLMDPFSTFRYIAKKNSVNDDFFNNYIIKVLVRPNGGLNEILGVVELKRHLDEDDYDTIILDTPPGKHFIDFLESCSRINSFFDAQFVEIFRYLGKKVSSQKISAPKKMMNMIVSTGIKKLLGYLEKVTGNDFVNSFIDAVVAIYENKETFLNALKLEDLLRDKSFCNWFLVTSIEHSKASEAINLRNQAKSFMHEDNFLCLNKCIGENLSDWNAATAHEIMLKQSLLKNELTIKSNLVPHFNRAFYFQEILSISPKVHVEDLSIMWKEDKNHDQN